MLHLEKKHLILLLLAVSLLKGMLWSLFTPAFQAPDENRHYLYMAYIAEFARLPRQDVLFVPHEASAVYNLLGYTRLPHASAKIILPYDIFEKQEKGIRSMEPSLRREGADEPIIFGNAQNYAPPYYILGALFYRILYKFDFIDRFFWIRLLMLILPLGSIYFCYRSALEFFKNEKSAIFSAFLVSFLPQYSFTSSMLNNDNLLILFVSAYIFLIFRCLNSELTYPRSFLLALVAGGAILTKIQALPIIFFSIPCFLYMYYLKDKKSLSRVFYHGLFMTSIIFVLSGWWYMRNFFYYGNIAGWIAPTYKSILGGRQFSFIDLIGLAFIFTFSLVTDFLGEFGWSDIYLPDFHYIFFSLLLAAWIPSFLFLILSKKLSYEHWSKIIFALICVISQFIFILYLFLSVANTSGYVGAFSQARSHFSLLALFSILFVVIFEYSPFSKFKNLCFAGGILYFTFLNLISLFNYMVIGYYV